MTDAHNKYINNKDTVNIEYFVTMSRYLCFL